MPVLMNAAPLKDQGGGTVGAVCSFQELTERKRAEEALRASEAELHSVINRTPFMLVRCTRDLRYRFISNAYAQMMGRHRDEIIGATIAETLGARGFATLHPYIERVLRGEEEVEFECELDFPEIGRRSFYIAYRPEHDANGDVGGWIASLLDMTEERQGDAARRQLASIVESSDDAIISKDLNGVIVSWNPGARRLFGYAAEEVVGKPITIIIPQELQDQEPVILGRIRRGERIDHFETVRRCKDGRLVDISLTVSPMKDERGKIVGASKIARDISARKHAEAVLARRADEQAALYRFTDRLYRAAILGGDLRGGLGCDHRGAALQPSVDPALRPRRGHALCRLARLVGSLSRRRRRSFAVGGRRSQSRARVPARYRRGGPRSPDRPGGAARRHPRAHFHSADGRRQAGRQIHDLLRRAARIQPRRHRSRPDAGTSARLRHRAHAGGPGARRHGSGTARASANGWRQKSKSARWSAIESGMSRKTCSRSPISKAISSA